MAASPTTADEVARPSRSMSDSVLSVSDELACCDFEHLFECVQRVARLAEPHPFPSGRRAAGVEFEPMERVE
jgi:hypothetical protein